MASFGWTTLPLQPHHQLRAVNPDIGRPQTTRPHHHLFTSTRLRRNRIFVVALSDKKGGYEAKVKSITQTMKELLESAKPHLMLEQLQIVDLLQRFGVDHLFRSQISEALHRQYQSRDEFHSLDLHQVSLCFRLLREHGYHLSSTETFKDYIDKQGKLDERRLGSDNNIQGLLSLFEASHMSTEGECILDEAKMFSKQLLNGSIKNLDETSAKHVHNTLKYPHHLIIARFKANDFVCEYKNAQGWRKEIVDLALMEFDRARVTYNDEILHISKWWKELGLAKELKLARDDTLQWHMWSLAALPDPALAMERIELTKQITFVYIIDDIFDIYGNQEDLCLFTETVNRWDLAIAEKLPDYMKKCLKVVFDITSHTSHVIWVMHGRNPEDDLRKEWIDLFNAFLVDSKWFASGQLPTTDEYMKIGRITCGVPLVVVHMMFLLGQGFDDYEYNNDAICNRKIYTNMVTSIATILRIGNDLGGVKDEDHVGHDGSYIACYMKENEGAFVKEAKDHSISRIWSSWKCMNGLCLQLPHSNPNSSPYTIATFKQGCLNLGRMVPLMYNYENDRSHIDYFMQSLLKL